MHIILAIASGAAFVFAFWVLGTVKSDIQIGIAVTAVIGGLILFGLAGIAARVNEIWRAIRGDDR